MRMLRLKAFGATPFRPNLTKNSNPFAFHDEDAQKIKQHKIYSPNRWYTTDGVSYPLKNNKYRKYYLKFYKDKIIQNNIEKIFTIHPLNKQAFDFALKENCFTTTQINEILFEHKLNNCKD